MGVADRKIGEYLEAIAASTPTPGGGSVAALCGALAASLSRMVANLAVGKEGYEGVQAGLKDLDAKHAWPSLR